MQPLKTLRILSYILNAPYYVCTVFDLSVEAGSSGYLLAVPQIEKLSNKCTRTEIKDQTEVTL